MSRAGESRRRGRGGFVWLLGATAAVTAMLYWEQTALLYVLSTLAVCMLLLVVAFSELEGGDGELNQPPPEASRGGRPAGSLTPSRLGGASRGGGGHARLGVDPEGHAVGGGPRRGRLGSVSTALVTGAHCPVEVVRTCAGE